MSDVCEVVEVSAVASSSFPAIEGVILAVEQGTASSLVQLGTTLPVITKTATASDWVEPSAYYSVLDTAYASSEVFGTVVSTTFASSTAVGASVLIVATAELLESEATASSGIFLPDIVHLLEAQAAASSLVTPNTSATVEVANTASASSSVVIGLLEFIESTATASSTITALRASEAVVVNSAAASSEVLPFVAGNTQLLSSVAKGESAVEVQIAAQQFIENLAAADGDVWYKDTSRVAWLMNTESTAVNWYNNFDFEAIAQPMGKVLAVGPDGLYEMTGNSDSGETIEAEVKSGFMDFKIPNTKRIDTMYFGYTSDGVISVTTETYESGHAPYTYTLEQRNADAPRNSRITPGKGMWGRYWRMTVSNVDGKAFKIHDASIDIAVSPRKL